MAKLRLDDEICPYCGADLVGDKIPESSLKYYTPGSTNYSRSILVKDMYDPKGDKIECPDCGNSDKVKLY
jgi:ribosomal protein S27AE